MRVLSSLLSLPQGDRPLVGLLTAGEGPSFPSLLEPPGPWLTPEEGKTGQCPRPVVCWEVTGQGIGPPAGQLGPRRPGSTPSSATHAL